MNDVIGDILPLALGVAISPVPIIAAILMLLSPRAKTTGSAFLIGWIAGILVAVTVFTLLAAILPDPGSDASQPVKGTVQLVLGAGLLLLAGVQWRKRPRPGQEPELPGWMKAIDGFTFVKAFGLAFVLAAVNPKNLLLAASAGLVTGSAGLSAGATALVIVIFTLIAASTVLVAVIGFLLAADRLREPLGALRVWLAKENAVIMAVLLLVLGVVLVGKGIASF